MDKSIAVLGTGAIGSSIGADFTKAGHNVILIDQWPAHVEAMKTRGLHVSLPEEELHVTVKAFHLCELCAIRPQLDIVFLTSKSYDTCWMVQFIQPYLKPDGVLVSVQNSLNDEWIAPIIGYERDIAAAIKLSASVFEPGLVRRNTDHTTTKFVVGELHGRITPRLEEVAQILSAAGKTETSSNIWGAKWTKLVLNSMMPGAITGSSYSKLIARPEAMEYSIRLARETAQVGMTLGYSLEPILGLIEEDLIGLNDEAFKKLLLNLISDVEKKSRDEKSRPTRVGGHTTQDILKGRHTEIDYINGLVVKKGEEAGVPTPFNKAITSIAQEIEQGTLKPDISNLKILEQCVFQRK
ncbi:ketopantoate reductase family protein [Chloroflexota bacterium]